MTRQDKRATHGRHAVAPARKPIAALGAYMFLLVAATTFVVGPTLALQLQGWLG